MGVGRTILDTAAWARTREVVAHRAVYRCQSCRVFTGMHGEADHIIPRAKCPAHGISPFNQSNLQWLCQRCHASKSAKERWDGKRRKGPKPIRRSKVPGRSVFLAMAGIPPDGKGQPP